MQRRLRIARPIELRVIRREVIAQTLHGDIVVANEALADLPEGERLFVLAHELGHVVLGHWEQMVQVYRKWVPGTVTQQQTDGVAQPLGRDASTLSHRQEFEADAFGLRAVRMLGLSDQNAVAAFMDLGMRNETATHPGTRKRVAALRSTEPDQLQAAAPAGAEH
ncbi:MAG: M48 family metalloprotease [Bacteriovorax sp.]|nr:M48 family metalloprotease [Rhizobacter sp.]